MKLFLEKTYGVKQQTEELQDPKCLFLLAYKVMIHHSKNLLGTSANEPKIVQDIDCIGFSKLIFETPPDAAIDMSVLGIDNNAVIENIELSKCYLRKGTNFQH